MGLKNILHEDYEKRLQVGELTPDSAGLGGFSLPVMIDNRLTCHLTPESVIKAVAEMKVGYVINGPTRVPLTVYQEMNHRAQHYSKTSYGAANRLWGDEFYQDHLTSQKK